MKHDTTERKPMTSADLHAGDEPWLAEHAEELAALTREAIPDELAVVAHAMSTGTCDERLVADALEGIAGRLRLATDISRRYVERHFAPIVAIARDRSDEGAA